MIISESREKVKKMVKNFAIRLKGRVTKPQCKFVMEMLMGILMTGSTNLTQISKSLKEKTKVKHTLKRLQRMSDQEELLNIANEQGLTEAIPKIGNRTILALDGGDVVHQYGNSFEKSSFVKDGSSGEIRMGYPLNQISGYNERSRETFPILLDIYSTLEDGFRSSNAETIEIVNRLVDRIDNKGLWVLDRAYDSGIVFEHFLDLGLRFIVRMKSTRNVIVKGESINIKKASKKINRRVKYCKKSRFGSEKVLLKVKNCEYKMTLISHKDKRNKEIVIFLTPGWIKSTKELKRRIVGYFKRWGVEESYRFEKQGFGIEKSTVRRYSGIKTLLGLTLMSWLVLIKINEDSRLKEVVLKEANMEKEKLKNRPKFIYYRLLTGIKEMFSGIRELFNIRWRRQKRERLKRKIKNELPPLLKKMNPPEEWLSDWMLEVA